jgi:hypothetical protein
MALVEKVIEFVTKKLSIEINEENQKLILDEFYPDIEDKIYWSFLNCRLYEGIITKDEYAKIKHYHKIYLFWFNCKICRR